MVGPSGSGKSERAEEQIQRHSRGLIAYIATLPPWADSAGRIERHRGRRGSNWVTCEAVDSVSENLRIVADAFAAYGHVLIDGVSILVWRSCCRRIDSDVGEARLFLTGLTSILACADSDWIVVDSDIPYPSLGPTDPFNQLMRSFHSEWVALADQFPREG